jgi:transcriptional regulator with XRE-family HTH domain
MSQESLAARANIDRSYMSSVERGLRNVSVLNVARIAAALGVPVWELLRPRDVRPAVVGRPIEGETPIASIPLGRLAPVPSLPPADRVRPDWEPRYLSLG